MSARGHVSACAPPTLGLSSQPLLTASTHCASLPFPLCSQDKVRQSLKQQQQKKTQDMPKPPGARPSALDRFVR